MFSLSYHNPEEPIRRGLTPLDRSMSNLNKELFSNLPPTPNLNLRTCQTTSYRRIKRDDNEENLSLQIIYQNTKIMKLIIHLNIFRIVSG